MLQLVFSSEIGSQLVPLLGRVVTPGEVIEVAEDVAKVLLRSVHFHKHSDPAPRAPKTDGDAAK